MSLPEMGVCQPPWVRNFTLIEPYATRDNPPEEDRMSVRALPRPVHPVLQHHEEHRSQNVQNRIADGITTFAGSMVFVYLHIGLFVVWMLFIEKKPWPCNAYKMNLT